MADPISHQRVRFADELELIDRRRITHVRDEEHARALLRRHADQLVGPCHEDDDALRRLARALVRGEILLAVRPSPRRLDPPGTGLIPRLADLGRDGDSAP